MKLNEDECHLLVFGEKEISIDIGGSLIKDNKEENF